MRTEIDCVLNRICPMNQRTRVTSSGGWQSPGRDVVISMEYPFSQSNSLLRHFQDKK